ncbi:hypothetical protein GGX14DRAFT_600710 [Mycena pura]|uniref:Uncharacterized protein n=1 Tax=Mycena pura TaxID=153505 RepID=A0AAD6UNT6_9AGAR|nr:hypothetical protein GGX14DRAFT_600710 [Mycena pura]
MSRNIWVTRFYKVSPGVVAARCRAVTRWRAPSTAAEAGIDAERGLLLANHVPSVLQEFSVMSQDRQVVANRPRRRMGTPGNKYCGASLTPRPLCRSFFGARRRQTAKAGYGARLLARRLRGSVSILHMSYNQIYPWAPAAAKDAPHRIALAVLRSNFAAASTDFGGIVNALACLTSLRSEQRHTIWFLASRARILKWYRTACGALAPPQVPRAGGKSHGKLR